MNQCWYIDVDPTSKCWLMLRQRWSNEQNDVGPRLYCNIGPTNDCYLGVYFFKYRLHNL